MSGFHGPCSAVMPGPTARLLRPPAAGYYSYAHAEIMSADAFAAFEEAGLDNEPAIREVGRRFRDTVLALGGSLHPAEVFRQFRGRDPNPEALLRHRGLLANAA